MCSNTSSSPSHTHSAFSPGNATAYRMFEYGNDATRQCTSVRLPATTACAKPKSACITPGDHSNSRYPSPGSRCSCLQRFTYRCTIWYEPSNPCSSTSLSYTRLAVCRCLRGMNLSACSHLSISGLYGSSFETAAGRAGGSGEQSSNCAYLRTVCLDTPTSFDMRRQDTPLASRILIRCCMGVGTVMSFPSRDTCEWSPRLGNPARPDGPTPLHADNTITWSTFHR